MFGKKHPTGDLKYVEHLCKSKNCLKISLFSEDNYCFALLTQLFDIPLDKPLSPPFISIFTKNPTQLEFKLKRALLPDMRYTTTYIWF